MRKYIFFGLYIYISLVCITSCGSIETNAQINILTSTSVAETVIPLPTTDVQTRQTAIPVATLVTQPIPTPTGLIAQILPSSQESPGPLFEDGVPVTLGVVVDKQMNIIDIEQGSAAEKADFQRGDTLVTVDNLPVLEHLEEIRQILREKNKRHVIQLKRNNAIVNISVVPSQSMLSGPTTTPVFQPNDYF